MIRIFTTTICPECQRHKAYLAELGIEYQTLDMESPAGRTELLFNGVFALDAPVLQVGSVFFTAREMFHGTEIKEELQSYLTRK
ncbi:glutaredoxin domain-containing protein [uncultured Aminobacterium sp.]|uniref:glutaredoxin family protein n=1 Tax=uncultured Aminobacterium sp. TaxID=548265 RepID=UPI0025970FCD|nr:glutaredoxin domain-containing protein [uncultured Aminobacterium sp.]